MLLRLSAIDHGNEALRQIVDRRDERDAHDQPIDAVEDERPQTRFDEKAEQENDADNNGEPEKIGDAGCRIDGEAERVSQSGDETTDKAAATGKTRDERPHPGDDEERDRDRQKGKHAGEEDA